MMSEQFVAVENEQIARKIGRHVHAVHLRRIAIAEEVVTRPVGRGAYLIAYASLHPRQRAADVSPLICWSAALLRLRHQRLKLGDVRPREFEWSLRFA